MKITVPCSTSNIGPGFDTLGLALNRYLTITVEKIDEPQAKITVEGEGTDHIATDETNLVYFAMRRTAAILGKTLPPVHIHLSNAIPSYGGLGSSGAAIAGGVFLANELFTGGLTRDAMLNIAVEIEGHPDNVSAAFFGGLTINCFDSDKVVHCRSVKIEQSLSVITCSPHFQVKTKQARKILPQFVSMEDAVTNIENAASLVATLMSGDFEALRYVTMEKLHEQYRSTLIPGFDAVKRAALESGALSFNISGAGPTVFSFAVNDEETIARSMEKAFLQEGQKATAEILKIENKGITSV